MKRKFALIIVLVGVVCLGIGAYLILTNDETISLESEPTFELIDKKYIENCLNTGCNVSNDLYAHLSYSGEVNAIDDALKTMNGNTDYYYDYVITSSFDGCEVGKDTYTYRKSINNDYYYYINDDYITFAVDRVEKDFCTTLTTVVPTEVYIYDKEEEKILSQDEFQSKLGYSSEELDKLITNYLKENNMTGIEESYFAKALYYKNDGKLYLSFSRNDEFMSILVR